MFIIGLIICVKKWKGALNSS